jgi:hypothetical protein
MERQQEGNRHSAAIHKKVLIAYHSMQAKANNIFVIRSERISVVEIESKRREQGKIKHGKKQLEKGAALRKEI